MLDEKNFTRLNKSRRLQERATLHFCMFALGMIWCNLCPPGSTFGFSVGPQRWGWGMGVGLGAGSVWLEWLEEATKNMINKVLFWGSARGCLKVPGRTHRSLHYPSKNRYKRNKSSELKSTGANPQNGPLKVPGRLSIIHPGGYRAGKLKVPGEAATVPVRVPVSPPVPGGA